VRDAYDLPTSAKRFADGGQYRIEIPSTEGPRAMDAVLQSAAAHGVPIHRISQGSGIMLQTDDEIGNGRAGRAHGVGVPVCRAAGERTSASRASTAGRGRSCFAARISSRSASDVLTARLGVNSIRRRPRPADALGR
jgi:hypothetical protein